MTVIEREPVTHEPGTDDPCFAHMPEGRVFIDGDMLTALCGARLIGVEAPDDAPHCPKCEAEIEAIYKEVVHE